MKAVLLGSRTLHKVMIKAGCEILQDSVIQKLREMKILHQRLDFCVVASDVEDYELEELKKYFNIRIDS